MKTRSLGWRQRRRSGGGGGWMQLLLMSTALFTVVGIFTLTLNSLDPTNHKTTTIGAALLHSSNNITLPLSTTNNLVTVGTTSKCAKVEEMAQIFRRGFREDSLRVRKIIHDHFALNGASRVRDLPPEEFCRHGFVIGKASEAGFGNEMYKILTGAALSVILNRSLIIGQTRDEYPFGDYISYSNITFTLKEVKHLWRRNGCLTKYGRHLVMRIDDFQRPDRTGVLCSNWKDWEQPIIWFQNTTDAVAAQFFLKNIHADMAKAATDLFGRPEALQYRPNVFGELMRLLISPSESVAWAVHWALSGRNDPDIVLHTRMLMNRSVRAVQAAVECIRKALKNLQLTSKPVVVVVSDTPSLVEDIAPKLDQFAEVVHFDYTHFGGNLSGKITKLKNPNIRAKDWGPAPRWVAFVDFFLAARAKHAVVSGAHRRVGTTYAQLIAGLAAAYRLDDYTSGGSNFTFLSSFQSNLLSEGLKNQVGWGHVWNRFAGPLSCHNQPNQCALTPLLPPAWWDGLWQSPLPRDVHRMEVYGIKLSGLGTFDDDHLRSVCSSRKNVVITVPLI